MLFSLLSELSAGAAGGPGAPGAPAAGAPGGAASGTPAPVRAPKRPHALREGVARVLFATAAALSIAAVALICLFLLVNGVPAMAKIGLPEFLFGMTWRPANDLFGIFPMIVGSLYVTAGAIVVGVPGGLLTAVYLSRFARGRVGSFLRSGVELLAGIPSVVYGFFGLVIIVPFVRLLGPGTGLSVLAASLILGIMILPTIITVAQSALDAVPARYYEGALALGVDHEHAVFKVVVPAAASGIMAAIVLGLGRAIGETMAVVMVAGNHAHHPRLAAVRRAHHDGQHRAGDGLRRRLAPRGPYRHRRGPVRVRPADHDAAQRYSEER